MTNLLKLNGLMKDVEPLLVVFYASWCPHCQRLVPALEIVEKRLGERLHVARFDIDTTEGDEISDYYKVQVVPTLLLFVKGEQVWRYGGELAPEMLEKMVISYVK